MSNRRRGVRLQDRVIATVMWLIAGSVVAVLAWILYDIGRRGLSRFSPAFLLESPMDAGRAGGIGPLIVSTLLILLVTLATALPLSIATAVALSEFTRRKSRFGRFVRLSLDTLAAVPSIVFGLFGNAFFCRALGMGFSILSGGLTLACMSLPIMIRIFEQAIRAVPDEYRQGAAALGLSKATTLWRIVLPTAAPALGAGLVLGIGRALAETAALIFTAGYVTRMPESLLNSGRSLSVHIYDLAMNVPGGNANAYATATVLVTLLLLINFVAMSLSRRAARHSLSSQAGELGRLVA